MSGEAGPRRSSRATKGQHAHLSSAAEESVLKQNRSKPRAKKAPEPTKTDSDDENAIIRCVCSLADEDDEGRVMIQCDDCEAWQHNDCMGITEKEDELPEKYFCEKCRPDDHADLLEKIAGVQRPREAATGGRSKKKRKSGSKKKSSTPHKSDGSDDKEASGDVGGPSETVSGPVEVAEEVIADIPAQKQKSRQTKVEVIVNVPPPSSTEQAPTSAAVIDPPALSSGGKRRQSRQQSSDELQLKRRKSQPTGPVSEIEELPLDRRKSVMHLQKTISLLIRTMSQNAGYRIPDGHTADSLGNQLSISIEYALFQHYRSIPAYSNQYRSIIFNVKRNNLLLERLLDDSLKPEDLATMSSDDMASEELQKEMAAMKEEADKQAVLIQEEGPRIRKTHKGEELVDDNPSSHTTHEQSFSALGHSQQKQSADADETKEKQTSTSLPIQSPISQTPPTLNHRKPPPIFTSSSPRGHTHERRASGNFNLQKVWSSAHSPQTETMQQYSPRSNIDTIASPKLALAESPGAYPAFSPVAGAFPAPPDDDIDRLLTVEEIESPPYSPTMATEPASLLWNGRLTMTNIVDLSVQAQFVAGGNIGQKLPWLDLIPKELFITGRISTASANEYVASLRYSETTDVACLSVIPVGGNSNVSADKEQIERLFSYLNERSRYGVVSTQLHPAVRDIYVVPVEAGASPLPRFVQMLENCSIEQPRPENMLLITLIVKTQSPLQSPHAPLGGMDAQAKADGTLSVGSRPVPDGLSTGLPLGLAAPQMSPVGATGTLAPVANESSSALSDANGHPRNAGHQRTLPLHADSPVRHAQPDLAGYGRSANERSVATVQILGPYASLPLVGELLDAQLDISDYQLRNLREVLDRTPAARTDLVALQTELVRLRDDHYL